MTQGGLPQEDYRRLVEGITAEVMRRMSAGPLPGVSGASELASIALGPIGWDCTGPSFTCGEYTCTGVVGCSGDFSCTIKFAGFMARARQ